MDASNPGNGNKHDSHLMGLSDGARVLKHSIDKSHIQMGSDRWAYNFVALVHETAFDSECTRILELVGFLIVKVPTPVDVEEIQHLFLRESIVKVRRRRRRDRRRRASGVATGLTPLFPPGRASQRYVLSRE